MSLKKVSTLIIPTIILFTSNSIFASSSDSSSDSATTGQSSSTRTASDVQTIITQDLKEDKTIKRKTGIGGGFFYNAKIILDTEKGDATVKKDFDKNYDADVEAGIFTFSKEIGTDLTVGIILPYRKIKVKDQIRSKLTMYSIVPFIKFRTMKKGNFYNDLSLYTFLSLNTLKTDLNFDNVKDKIDYKELGVGATINPTYKFSNLLTFDFNFGYQYSAYSVSASDVKLSQYDPASQKFIAERFKPRHLVNLGTSLTINPFPNGKVIVGYAYSSNVLGSQRLRAERANYYYIKAYYTFWLFKVSLGYKKTDDANNYEEDTYMASVGLNF